MAEHDLIAVACLDPVEKGIIRRIPRHLTIVPWFTLQSDELTPLHHEFTSATLHIAPLHIRGKGEVLFGPENDVVVRKIGEKAILANVHQTLKQIVERLDGTFRHPEYIGSNYEPHISKQEDGYFAKGEQATLDSIQLIEAVESIHGRRRIVAQYRLEG